MFKKVSIFLLSLILFSSSITAYAKTNYDDNWDITYINELLVSGVSEGISENDDKNNSTSIPQIKPMILDMDFCTDVDDACALRMAINMHRQNLIELEAVTLCTNDEENRNIKAVDGLMDYVGVSAPIGQGPIYVHDTSPYWDILAEYSDGDYALYDSVKLWRRIISENDLTYIVTTGYLNNLQKFCESGPDEYSNLNGMELLNKTKIYIVGGSYPTGRDNNFSYEPSSIEASEYVTTNIKNRIVWITNDVGGPILCGGNCQEIYPDDPLSRSLFAFGTSNGRAAWDPSGVYIAVFGENSEGFKATPINISIINGETNITDDENGIHLRVTRTSDDYEWYKNKFEEYMLH